jgi:hypothetical protein
MKKRKAYRPKHVNPNAWTLAMQGARLLSKTDQLIRADRLHGAVERLIASAAQLKDWGEVFDAINMVEALEQTHAHAIRDAREFVEAHQANVVSAMDRQRETGSNVLTVAECQMLRDLSAAWAEVLGVVTHREYFAAEERVYHKVQQALRNPASGVRVVEAA